MSPGGTGTPNSVTRMSEMKRVPRTSLICFVAGSLATSRTQMFPKLLITRMKLFELNSLMLWHSTMLRTEVAMVEELAKNKISSHDTVRLRRYLWTISATHDWLFMTNVNFKRTRINENQRSMQRIPKAPSLRRCDHQHYGRNLWVPRNRYKESVFVKKGVTTERRKKTIASTETGSFISRDLLDVSQTCISECFLLNEIKISSAVSMLLLWVKKMFLKTNIWVA